MCDRDSSAPTPQQPYVAMDWVTEYADGKCGRCRANSVASWNMCAECLAWIRRVVRATA